MSVSISPGDNRLCNNMRLSKYRRACFYFLR